ncbi:MarR family winged helix-turn-helix transcriptional regulator [Subtercola endophyticus]|uniref:MarR family winged helix-turn-helix transcriptional regulator n=1 Tax=Subtercola endophyticus TaxID=2895559 RepID=UPI001E369591|nr:MarR family winged helix-turn-helix transcriptional regulator [Subtercola endophyticus]UFS59589.1 MarR family winged helix-turn-helix transcriptional regulator [Subtercola endophyticus]
MSQLLVAFTIEVDNEFEQWMPHRTAATRAAGIAARGPWLASLAMWLNFLQYIPDPHTPDGISLADLRQVSHLTKPQLSGMVRWGYVTVGGASGTDASAVRAAVAAGGVIHRTSAGSKAAAHWRAALADVESRWRDRYGSALIADLRAALVGIAASLEPAASPAGLPDYLPEVGPGFWMKDGLLASLPSPSAPAPAVPPHADVAGVVSLPTAMSRALLLFALDFERRSPVSLVLYADFLSAFAQGPVRASDLSLATGVTPTTAQTACGFLERSGWITTRPDPVLPRRKLYQLTPAGTEMARRAAADYREALDSFRANPAGILIAVADRMHAVGPAPLAAALAPPLAAWRASIPFAAHTSAVRADPFAHLPRFPLVTHRGGYPDGS